MANKMKKQRRGRDEGALWEDKKRKRWTTWVLLDGKRYTGHAKTKDLARLKLLDLQLKAHQGLLNGKPQPGTVTVEQVVRDYVDYRTKEGKIGPSTAQRYEELIKGKIVPAFGSLPVVELTREHVRELYPKEYETTTPASVLKLHNLLSASLKEAIEKKIISVNVCSKALRPKVETEEEQHFQDNEVEKLFTYAKQTNHRDTNLVIVGIRTGLRSGELLGLQWADVDLKKRTLTVRHSLQNFGPARTLGKTKNRKLRTVPLSIEAFSALKAQQELLLCEGHPRPWVFPDAKGNTADRHSLFRRFQALCDDAEVPVLKVHSMRHTFASTLLGAGVALTTVSRLMGHSSIVVTANTYGHLAKDDKHNAIEQMDRHLTDQSRAAAVSMKGLEVSS